MTTDEREYQRLYRLAFPSQHRAYEEKYYRNGGHSVRLAGFARYRAKHREQLRVWHRTNWQKNKEKRRATWARTLAKRPDYYKAQARERCRIRYARKKRVEVVDCRPHIFELEKEPNCYWCGVALNVKNRNIDHIIPLAKGGKHHPDNLVASCKKCNCLKGALLPDQWLLKKEAA